MTDWTALRRTIEAATPGPWTTGEEFPSTLYVEWGYPDMGFGTGNLEPADAVFIATARTAMPEMLALLEKARDVLLRHELEHPGWLSIGDRDLIARLPEPPRRQWRDDPDEDR